jgi:hypothetical protein
MERDYGTYRKARQTISDWRDVLGRSWRLDFDFVTGLRPIGLECVGLEIHSAEDPPVPVTGTLLRQLPLATLIDRAQRMIAKASSQAAANMAEGLDFAHDQGWDVTFDDIADNEQFEFWAQQSGERRGRPPTYGVDHFRQVAEVYLANYQTRLSAPTKAVAERWGVNRSTANKWVARSRALGFLGSTRRGVPG